MRKITSDPPPPPTVERLQVNCGCCGAIITCRFSVPNVNGFYVCTSCIQNGELDFIQRMVEDFNECPF